MRARTVTAKTTSVRCNYTTFGSGSIQNNRGKGVYPPPHPQPRIKILYTLVRLVHTTKI
jgi:hypothetical protein